jgi:hypothetical protein
LVPPPFALGDLSIARTYIDVAVAGGRIYALGGATWDGSSLLAQARAEVTADPEGAGTWDDAAVADPPTATAEGQAFGFDPDTGHGLENKVVIAGGGQWPGNTAEVLVYDTEADSYDDAFANLITARRDHSGVLVPLTSDDPTDGLPGLWVYGGNATGDVPPYGGPEYYALAAVEHAIRVTLPLVFKGFPPRGPR